MTDQPTDMVERVAIAMWLEDARRAAPNVAKYRNEQSWLEAPLAERKRWRGLARAAIAAMREPECESWDGLARDIVMWMDMGDKTPRALFKHLERTGRAIPQWLRDEPEMKALDHVPSKGTRAVLIYRAMIDAALGEDR